MAAVKEIFTYLDSIAPFHTQMDFDNAGLLLGHPEWEVGSVLVALDVTCEVAQEAARRKCGLIVSHHPVIFHPLKSVTPTDPTGKLVSLLLQRRIAVISAHTNLDVAQGGVNDALMDALGIPVKGILEPMGELDGQPYGLGRWGVLQEEMTPAEFAKGVKRALHARGARAVLGKSPVRTVAVCGGAGGDLVARAAALGADAYVTADVKYHEFLEAKERGMTLIDGGHFATENVVVPVLQHRLAARFEREGVDVFCSKRHKEAYASL